MLCPSRAVCGLTERLDGPTPTITSEPPLSCLRKSIITRRGRGGGGGRKGGVRIPLFFLWSPCSFLSLEYLCGVSTRCLYVYGDQQRQKVKIKKVSDALARPRAPQGRHDDAPAPRGSLPHTSSRGKRQISTPPLFKQGHRPRLLCRSHFKRASTT